MERIGVISRVENWCAGMVVVPKKTGAVRICVDLKPLNSNVLREPHPIPTVDDTLSLLSGATRFSKLDANSGRRVSPPHHVYHTFRAIPV